MNRQPYGVPPKWWEPRINPFWIRLSKSFRHRYLRRKQRLVQIETAGLTHLQQAVADGNGVLIVANHSVHYDSAALYLAADSIRQPLFFMTAWQVFEMGSRFDRFLMQRLGCFSVDRESNDRQAYKKAVEILRQEPYPLVIFPEGDIYHVTDRVSSFREGAAAIALSAAKRGERPVVVIPCGIKFFYIDDPMQELLQVMQQLEERVLIRSQTDRPLIERIYRLAEGVMALKELDYLGCTRSGPLRERIDYLNQSILSRLEQQHQIKVASDRSPERVKSLRQQIIQKAEQRDNLPTDRGSYFRGLEQDMDDLFFVMQLYSYPGDYLRKKPTTERLAETIDKLEEDILGLDLPNVRGSRRVEIQFGEPIQVKPTDKRRHEVAKLSHTMQASVQTIIDQLNEPKTDH